MSEDADLKTLKSKNQLPTVTEVPALNRATITAAAIGLVVGTLIGFTAGRAAADALFALDVARHWFTTAGYNARAAAGPLAAVVAVVCLAGAIVAFITTR